MLGGSMPPNFVDLKKCWEVRYAEIFYRLEKCWGGGGYANKFYRLEKCWGGGVMPQAHSTMLLADVSNIAKVLINNC